MLRHNPGEVRRFAMDVAMPLWEQGYGVWWEDLEDDASQIYGTRFRVEQGIYRSWFAVTDIMVTLARDSHGMAGRITREIRRQFERGERDGSLPASAHLAHAGLQVAQ